MIKKSLCNFKSLSDKEGQFTTVPFKPLSDNPSKRYRRSYLFCNNFIIILNSVDFPLCFPCKKSVNHCSRGTAIQNYQISEKKTQISSSFLHR